MNPYEEVLTEQDEWYLDTKQSIRVAGYLLSEALRMMEQTSWSQEEVVAQMDAAILELGGTPDGHSKPCKG